MGLIHAQFAADTTSAEDGMRHLNLSTSSSNEDETSSAALAVPGGSASGTDGFLKEATMARVNESDAH